MQEPSIQEALRRVLVRERIARKWSRRGLATAAGLGNAQLQQFEEPRRGRPGDMKTGSLVAIATTMGMHGWHLLRLAEEELEVMRRGRVRVAVSLIPEEGAEVSDTVSVCAGCGSEDLMLNEMPKSAGFTISCCDCGCEGPRCATRIAAIEAWNDEPA